MNKLTLVVRYTEILLTKSLVVLNRPTVHFLAPEAHISSVGGSVVCSFKSCSVSH